ncbi:class I SAM-dependent RNA methyltransferase, partial [candidate division WWE3 bacterium]|nr:class I SAM-dependent RNA methyltransferase [candidate division WWE3 bacterium]
MSNLCPKKEVCGSCSLSDQPYETQLSNKLLEINKEFITNGFNPHVSKIIPSPKTSHYRNRMDFVISYQGEIGLRQKGKWWKVIDDHTCFISEEKLEQVFKLSRDYIRDAGFTYFDRKTFEGFLRYLAIRCTKSGSVLINIVTSSPLKNSDEEKQKLLAFCAYLTPKVQDLTIVWSINNTLSDVSFGEEQSVLVGSGFITETINGYSYKITPNSFFQTNSYAGEKLQSTVLEFLGDIKEKKILDLYCGSGFFT